MRRGVVGMAGFVMIGIFVITVRGACAREARHPAIDGESAARALCLAATEYREAHGAWPGDLKQLDFDPGTNGLTFEIRPSRTGVECIARSARQVFTATAE